MEIGPHVFGDNRLGLWIVNPQNLRGRLSAIRSFAGGQITDLYLPREASRDDFKVVREGSLFAHLWVAPHGRPAATFAAETLKDISSLKPGAVELNIEVPDAEIHEFVSESVTRIRASRKSLRLRVNIAPFKARFLPVSLFGVDPHLYLIEQSYFGNMDGRASEDDVRRDMLGAGIPEEKGSVMYAAHCSPEQGKPRVPALPSLKHRRLYRGSIYQDDLMADAGYL